MKVNAEAFRKIQSGKQTVELRLYDDESKAIHVGDIITFKNRDNENDYVHARVRGYHRYQSFAELYERVDKTALGYDETDKADPEDMRKFYSDADEYAYGVIGIIFELAPDFKTLDEMTVQEVEQWLKNLIKQSKKIYRKFGGAAYDNIERAKAFIMYIEKYPELFADNSDYVELDFFKRVLRESITQTQSLLDKIQETEDKIGMPVINKY